MLRTRLDVRHLHLMLAIEETGSVTRAAELLGLTQPALSRQIREAERRLGTSLYERVNKRLRLTPAGDCLLQSAKRILRDLDRAESDAMEFPLAPQSMVRIAIGAYPWHLWLPRFLTGAGTKLEGIEIEMVKFAGHRAVQALLQNEIDLAIAAGPLDGRGLRAFPLFEDELVAILPPGHALASKAVLEAADFADQVFVTYGPTYEKGYETDRVLRPANVWPRKLVKVDQTEGIAAMVAAGLGVSVLSRWAVAAHAQAGRLALARVTAAGLPIAWRAVVRRGERESGAAVRLAQELARWCGEDPMSFAQAGGAPLRGSKAKPAARKRASRRTP
jgi:LysR family transcriptional regulator for metE and metH